MFQGAILRQTDQLAFIVADQGDGIVEWVDGFDEAADEGLHGCEGAIDFDGAGFNIRLDK